MRTMRTIVLACLGLLGGASCHPLHSRQPQLGALAPRPHRSLHHRSLHALRGGGRTVAVVEPPPPPQRSGEGRHSLKLFSLCAAIVLSWIGGATVLTLALTLTLPLTLTHLDRRRDGLVRVRVRVSG